MPHTAEMRILLRELSFRVLRAAPVAATAEAAAAAIVRFLERKRPALIQALDISPGGAEVVLRAFGEAPEEMLRETRELLGVGAELKPAGELAVDAAMFVVEGDAGLVASREGWEILRSTVRYFPFPECEWFEINTGPLVLDARRVVYTPEYVIMQAEEADAEGRHVIQLAEIIAVWRGEWWDLPCLMIETPELTYRYGWPAARGDVETLLNVDEWIRHLRHRIGGSQ